VMALAWKTEAMVPVARVRLNAIAAKTCAARQYPAVTPGTHCDV
jgi:hypothetical protein